MTADEFVAADHRGPYPGAVASMVGYRQQGITQPLHRGLPSPYLTLVLGLDGPVVVGETAQDVRPVAAKRLLGPLASRPAYIIQARQQEGVQLAVHPFAARWLFGAPASRLPGLALDLEDVAGSAYAALGERVGEGPDWGHRFDLVRDFLVARATAASGAAAARPRREVVEGWRWIAARGGGGRIDDLAAHLGLGPRRLRSVFVEELGVGPKVLSRLVRFERATRAIRERAVGAGAFGDETLADVAARTGYADHAHLTREFRTLAGTSPTGWVEEERRNHQAARHVHEAG